MTTPRKRTRKVEEYTGLSALTGTVIKTDGLERAFPVLKSQTSRQVEDEFQGFYGAGAGGDLSTLEPLYPPNVLNRYALASGVLRTCIDALATNIDGFGYTLEYIGPEGAQESAEALEEEARVRGVLDHPNGEYSLIDLRKRFRVDKESCGYGTMEVIRNADDGFPDILYHVPSYTMRMTAQESLAVSAFRYMPRPGSKDNMMEVRTRFRRYVQMAGSKRVWFRENGDTRAISATDGKAYGGPSERADDATYDVASDIVFDSHYAPGSRYGAPRWIGELRSVLGLQESENTNLAYFKDNGIPAMMLLVLGGALSQKAQQDFQSLVQQARGSGMQNKIVMMEIAGDPMMASDKGMVQRPEVKLEPLLQVRQSDAFFQTYELNSSKKVRSSFRLPAILTGLTEEVTYAVAQASLTLAESQVFAPERNQTDDLFNYQILTYNGEPMRYWRMKSNPPRIQDAQEVMNALDTLEAVGAMTPNIAIELANGLFDMSIERIEDGWGDMPFSLVTAGKIDPETGQIKETETDTDSDNPGADPGNVLPFQKPVPASKAEVRAKARKAIRTAQRAAQGAGKRHRDADRPQVLKTVKPAHRVRMIGRRVVDGSAGADSMQSNYQTIEADE